MKVASGDTKTVKAFLNGDQDAFDSIHRLMDAAFSSWRRKLGGYQDEIYSDVTLKLLQTCSSEGFKLKSGLGQLVWTLLNRTCISRWRVIIRRPEVDFEELGLASKSASAEDSTMYAELLSRLWESVPDECKTIWELSFQGFTYSEIAGRLRTDEGKSKTEGFVKWRVNKCRERSAEVLEKLGLSGKLF